MVRFPTVEIRRGKGPVLEGLKGLWVRWRGTHYPLGKDSGGIWPLTHGARCLLTPGSSRQSLTHSHNSQRGRFWGWGVISSLHIRRGQWLRPLWGLLDLGIDLPRSCRRFLVCDPDREQTHISLWVSLHVGPRLGSLAVSGPKV